MINLNIICKNKQHVQIVLNMSSKHLLDLTGLLQSMFDNHKVFSYEEKLNSINTRNMFLHPVVLSYMCPIWGFDSKTNLNELYRTHNRQHIIIRNGNRYPRNATKCKHLCTKSLKNAIHQLTKFFYNNINNIPNETIAELPDCELCDTVHRKRHRFALLVEEEHSCFFLFLSS